MLRYTTGFPLLPLAFQVAMAVCTSACSLPGSGPPADAIATVNGEPISASEFVKVMREAVIVSNKPILTAQEQEIISRQVIDSLVAIEVMLQEADRLGVEVTDADVARHLVNVRSFKDSRGVFSQALHDHHVKSAGLTKRQFEREIRDQLRIDRLKTWSPAV